MPTKERLNLLAKNLGIKGYSKMDKTILEKTLENFPTTKGGIPKVIHQIWLGGPIPEIQSLYMKTWKQMNGWTYKLWSDKDITIENFPITYPYIQDSLKIGREQFGNVKKKYAQVSDFMRLEILYHNGGLYADATLEALKNFNTLLDKKSYQLVLCNEDTCGFNCHGRYNKKYISNSFIASIPYHPALNKLLDWRKLDTIKLESPLVNVESGPYYLGYIKPIEGVVMLPTELIYPHIYESAYRKEVPDNCVSWKRIEGVTNKVIIEHGKEIYLQYPCKQFPDSYAIKHWDVGGSWLIK